LNCANACRQGISLIIRLSWIGLVVAACNRPQPTLAPLPTSAPATATATLPPPAAWQTPSHAATEISPPSQGAIVYTCQLHADSLRNQICWIQPDGSGQQRLTTDDSADHFYPSWAPDRASVVYSANPAGPHEIYEHRLGGAPIRLTTLGEAFAPAISPDGGLIAFTHIPPTGAELWLMNRNGSNPRRLIDDGWDATWSPDGAWILHASKRDGTIQLWRTRPDGSQLEQVTQLEGLRGRNDWSGDGAWLATYAGGPWTREILVFNPAGGDMVQVTAGGNNLAPSFSPDGAWIAYTSYVDRFGDENGCEIYVLHWDTGVRFRLTDNEYCDWQPRWGP